MSHSLLNVRYGLRASVASDCNMSCEYCPRETSMEDYTPDRYRHRGINHVDYLDILRSLLSAVRFSSVSLTGGEPTMNPHLPEIAATVRPYTPRLELNTNGLLLTHSRWRTLRPYFDRVKISLDTLDSVEFKKTTAAPGRDPKVKVLQAIDLVAGDDVELAINCVISRSSVAGVNELIDYAARRGVRLHLLDYYFTEERRQNWQEQFIPIEAIMPSLTRRFGQPVVEPRFGCGFLQYDVPSPTGRSSVLQLKTSYSGTMRAPRCSNCSYYCQEGMYGMKISTDGWVTTCPSNEERDGILLNPRMETRQVVAVLEPLLSDLASTYHVPESMTIMADRRSLTSPVWRDESYEIGSEYGDGK